MVLEEEPNVRNLNRTLTQGDSDGGPAAAGGGARGLSRTPSPPAPLSTVRPRAEGHPGIGYPIPTKALPAG